MRRCGWLYLSLLIILPQASAQPPVQPEPRYHPFVAAKLALADLATIPPERHPYIRWLSLTFATAKERQRYFQSLSFQWNNLSKKQAMSRLVPLENGLALRVYLDEIGMTPGAWDQLATAGSGPKAARSHESYHYQNLVPGIPAPAGVPVVRGVPTKSNRPDHATVAMTVEPADATITFGATRITQTGRNREVPVGPFENNHRVTMRLRASWPDGRSFEADLNLAAGETVPIRVAPAEAPAAGNPEKLATAPWLAQEDQGKTMLTLTAACQTQYPILRGDWFLYFSSIAPAYYDLLGLGKTKKEFEEFAFTDLKLAAKGHAETRGLILKSTVALHTRTLDFVPTFSGPAGGVWSESHDFNRSVKDARFFDLILHGKPVAYEVIFNLPNGLQAYGLFDGEEKRLDFAVAEVAIDNETKFQDKQVWTMRNCATCHSQGMRPVDCKVRAISQRDLTILIKDPVIREKVQDRYGHPVEVILSKGVAIYAAAVFTCNGLKPEANATQFEALIWDYFEGPIDLDRAARERGLPTETVRKMLIHANRPEQILQNGFNLDPTLAGFLQNPPEVARRDQFEDTGYPQLMMLPLPPDGE